LRWPFGIRTSFFIPAVSGRRRIFSESRPAMHAAVASVSADAAPAVTSAASQPSSAEIFRPTAACSSPRWTKRRDADSIASRTGRGIRDALR
jgi:hypothetical protein